MEKQKLKEKSNVGALSVRNTRKKLPNCAQKENKGITLVALIITIIVLLILAVVAIRAVQGDRIITKAKEAKSATTVEQEKEQIQLAINEWQIQKNQPNNPYGNFKEFMEEKYSDIIENPDGSLNLKTSDNNEYTVTEDGTITEPPKNGEPVVPPTPLGEEYTFKLSDIMKLGTGGTDITRLIPLSDFWPEDISANLKNSAFSTVVQIEGENYYYVTNLTCSDTRFSNPYASDGDKDFEKAWICYAMLFGDSIGFVVVATDNNHNVALNDENYESLRVCRS